MAAPQPAAAAPAPEAPPSAQVVGNAFVQQYYLVLHQSPDLVYRFYQDASRVARPASAAGAAGMESVTTMEAISGKIMEMDVAKAEIRTVDSQESLGGGVTVLVTGHLTGRDGVRREFSQSFFLAPQEKGYFVLNDMFRFVGDGPAPAAVEAQPEVDAVVPPVAAPLANGIAAPVVEPAVPEHDAAQQQEHQVVEPAAPQPDEEDEAEVYNPPPEEVVDDEQPVPEVINEVPNNVASVVATTVASVSQEEAPKKSYASIVKVMKEVPLPAPAPPRPAPPKPEQAPAPAPVTDVPSFSSNPENSTIQEPEVDAHAIYVRSLPLNATETQLEDEFKKFGAIKQNGIQVRSNKIQGFCYGFVEFEDATSVQSAIEAPAEVAAGLHQAGVTTSEMKVPEAVVTTVVEGAMEGVNSVTGPIMGAEVVDEMVRHGELMLATRGLNTQVVVVVAQQLLVHPQNEGHHSCTSLGMLFHGPQIVPEVDIELHQLVECGITRKPRYNLRVPVFLTTIFAGNKSGKEVITNCRIYTYSDVVLVLVIS